MLRPFCLLCSLVVALSSCLGAGERACAAAVEDDRPVLELALDAQASAASDRVTLRDIVTVVHDDADVARRLLSLDLGPAPRVGQPARLQQRQVEEWVRVYRPALAIRIAWSGAADVQVVRASQAVAADALVPLARRALDEWLRPRSDSYVIEPLRAVEPVAVASGEVSLAARPLPRIGEPASHMTVWIDISVDGRFQRSVDVDFHVQALRRAWIAAQDLGIGQDLDAAAVTLAQVDVAQSPQALWAESPERARMRRAVRRGQALTALDVEARPPVVRGERVQVSSHVGDLSIETSAEALQDGRAGQDVLVRIATSREPVMARVLKPGLVEIRQ